VGTLACPEPDSSLAGKWLVCGPDTVPGFSAVAYFFGRHLRRELKVPVGLIQSAVGGTPAESWTPAGSLASDPELRKHAERKTQALADYPAARLRFEEQVRVFDASGGYDPATRVDDAGWEKADFDDGAWGVLPQPMAWEGTGIEELKLDGTLWCRRAVEIPADWEGKDLILRTCPIDEEDQAYFNGEWVGGLKAWTDNRTYPVPGRRVKAGRAVLAFRVTDRAGIGGIIGEPADFRLERAGDSASFLPLAGEWRYRVAGRFLPRPAEPLGPGHALLPSGLFNGMIAPLIPFRIRGVIWYQGESNAGLALEYRRLFPALIRGWREAWGQGDFPFIWVQLANYMWFGNEQPGESKWAELREAQTRTLSLPNTGQALAIDIGEARDIHPKNKQEVGRRLALIALDRTYGRPTVYSGPVFRAVRFGDGRAVVSFDHTDGGLVARGGVLRQFSIAGPDRKFVWAEAGISNDTVEVSSALVPEPVAVRYAWAENPAGCNLYNGAGLPACPFRTDGDPAPAP
jgi:sialate O-acetylesterase